jgi:hypothetical protein
MRILVVRMSEPTVDYLTKQTKMKKKLLFTSLLTMGALFNADAQVIFSEDFQGGAMPAGFTITNVDGLPVHANVAQFTDAWIVADDFNDAADKTAQSTSWYDPAGQSNDWMSTGAISLLASGNTLSWEARAQDSGYPDGYQVYVNTTGATPADMLAGTMVFSVANESDVNIVHSVNIDAFATQTVYIGWRNNSTDQFILLIDDISVEALSSIDGEMTAITTSPFQAAPANVIISFDFTNTGANAIMSFDANWTDGTSSFNQTFATSLVSLASANFTFTDQLPITAGNAYNVVVTISNVNGAGADGNSANDAGSLLISGMSFIPTKVVVGEEATGTWCGWCPRGWDFMEYMAGTYPSSWVGIAVHNSDPMAVVNYDAGMGATIGGYPSGHVDRAPGSTDIDPSAFESAYASRVTEIPPAAINLSTSISGQVVTITVEADFAAAVSGDYRLNCVVTEDGIQNNAYNQTNYYAGGTDPLAGWGMDWGAEADPTAGSLLTYNHVARAILGDWAGQVGSIPAVVNAGEQHSYTFTYTVPATQDMNNMHVVGMLIDQSNGEIVNAGKGNLLTAGLAENEVNFDLSVFPNPSNGLTNVNVKLKEASEVSVEVYNMVGHLVSSKNYGTLNGENILPFDGSKVDAGVYLIKVSVNGERLTKKVTITK